jgi:hypothetical protein
MDARDEGVTLRRSNGIDPGAVFALVAALLSRSNNDAPRAEADALPGRLQAQPATRVSVNVACWRRSVAVV